MFSKDKLLVTTVSLSLNRYCNIEATIALVAGMLRVGEQAFGDELEA